MSEIEKYMIDAVQSYLIGGIDVDQFRQTFAGAYFYARNRSTSEPEANDFASKLMAPIAEYSTGHRSEQSLRLAMADILRMSANVRRTTREIGLNAKPRFYKYGDAHHSTYAPAEALI